MIPRLAPLVSALQKILCLIVARILSFKSLGPGTSVSGAQLQIQRDLPKEPQIYVRLNGLLPNLLVAISATSFIVGGCHLDVALIIFLHLFQGRRREPLPGEEGSILVLDNILLGPDADRISGFATHRQICKVRNPVAFTSHELEMSEIAEYFRICETLT